MKCKYCGSECPDHRKLNHHLYTYHPREPDLILTCGIQDCPATYNKVNSLTSHQSRKHSLRAGLSTDERYDEPFDEVFVEQGTGDETADNRNANRGNQTNQRENQAAMFVQSLRAKSNMAEKNVRSVIDVTDSMLSDERLCTIAHISAALKDKGIDLEKEINIEAVTSESSRFKNLQTKYMQDKYFSENFKVLQPELRALQRKPKLAPAKEDVNRETVIGDDFMAYIPPTKLVDNLICARGVSTDLPLDLSGEEDSENNILGGFQDGELFKCHDFFKAHPDGLQIILYYDEVEICNPIGSQAGKHKLGMFYLTFANIDPKYRSMLKSIHLVAIVNVSIMKECGIDAVLEVIVKDLKKLEVGFVLSNGKTIFGCLIAFIGDNLGLHAVAGLKEGFTAYRLCRICFLPIDQIRTRCCEEPDRLRTREQFDRQVNEIEAAPDAETRKALSTEYGINRRCALNSLLYYHTINGLPLVCMHDFLEGTLALTTQLLLRKVCGIDKRITLDRLNILISEFDYGYSEENKPAKIKPQHLVDGGSLSQSASQMWLLGNILPLLIGDLFDEDDPYWENFIFLLEATSIVFAHKISHDMVEYLHCIIERYLFTFRKLYKETLTPKQHFLTHYSRMILQFGPIIHFWVMRQEAKHQYFKRVMRTINNWKNVPLSLSNQHELTQAWNYLAPIQKSMQVGEPVETATISLACPALFDGLQTVHLARWVVVNGTKFMSGGCYVALKQEIQQPLPKFAFLEEIIFASHELIFVCKSVETIGRDVHRAAYEIKKGSLYEKLKLVDIQTLSVYHAHTVGLQRFIFTNKGTYFGVKFQSD